MPYSSREHARQSVVEPRTPKPRAVRELDRLAMLTTEGEDEPVLYPTPEGECSLCGPRTRRELKDQGRLA